MRISRWPVRRKRQAVLNMDVSKKPKSINEGDKDDHQPNPSLQKYPRREFHDLYVLDDPWLTDLVARFTHDEIQAHPHPPQNANPPRRDRA